MVWKSEETDFLSIIINNCLLHSIFTPLCSRHFLPTIALVKSKQHLILWVLASSCFGYLNFFCYMEVQALGREGERWPSVNIKLKSKRLESAPIELQDQWHLRFIYLLVDSYSTWASSLTTWFASSHLDVDGLGQEL